jgi:hypothetical protein
MDWFKDRFRAGFFLDVLGFLWVITKVPVILARTCQEVSVILTGSCVILTGSCVRMAGSSANLPVILTGSNPVQADTVDGLPAAFCRLPACLLYQS